MIDEADARITAWVISVLGETPVSLHPPAAPDGGRGVNVYLLRLVHTPPTRASRPPPLQVTLHYLVSTWAETPPEAHRMLGTLIFAAMEHAEMEVQTEPVPAETWAAFGVPPRPSFVLRVPLRRERPAPVVPLVRGPIVMQVMTMVPLAGVVVGPGDVPLVRARVELPSLELTQYTDRRGRFRFSGIPAEPRQLKVRVQAKGRDLTVTAERPAARDQPLVIHFEPLEG